jgi:hypothetical protein
MDKSLIHENWKCLCQFLPEKLSELAKASGAVERWRNVKNVETYSSPCHGGSLVAKYRRLAHWPTQAALELKDTPVVHHLRKALPLLQKVLAHLLTH